MVSAGQDRGWIFRTSLRAATAALAIAFTLTVVASQAAQAQTFNIIHTFTGGPDGGYPIAGVTLDRAGNLYGTAFLGGGAGGFGTVYQLKPRASGGVFNILYTFTGGSDGANPAARVIFGPNGTLYATTYRGGAGYGTVSNLT